MFAERGIPMPPQGSDTMAPVVLGITMGFFSLAVIIVMIRLYSRAYLAKFLGADDWWMIAATVFAAGDEVLKMLWCFHGLGLRSKYVTKGDMAQARRITYAIVVTYPISLGLVKISILSFYLRVFPSETFRKVCYGSIVTVVALSLSVCVAQALACHPIRAGWDISAGGHCLHRDVLQYCASVLNLVTDLAILLLPMKYLWALSLEPKKRVQTIAVFSLGLLTCIASAVRVSFINVFYNGTDHSYDAWPIALCSGIEVNLAIITASLPSIKPFVLKYFWRPMKCLSARRDDESPKDSRFSESTWDSERKNMRHIRGQRLDLSDGTFV